MFIASQVGQRLPHSCARWFYLKTVMVESLKLATLCSRVATFMEVRVDKEHNLIYFKLDVGLCNGLVKRGSVSIAPKGCSCRVAPMSEIWN